MEECIFFFFSKYSPPLSLNPFLCPLVCVLLPQPLGRGWKRSSHLGHAVLKAEGNRLMTEQKLSGPLCSPAITVFPLSFKISMSQFLYRVWDKSPKKSYKSMLLLGTHKQAICGINNIRGGYTLYSRVLVCNWSYQFKMDCCTLKLFYVVPKVTTKNISIEYTQ